MNTLRQALKEYLSLRRSLDSYAFFVEQKLFNNVVLLRVIV